MEYSEVLKEAIIRWQHVFVYGEEQERIKYLMHLANEYKYDRDKEQPFIIYTDYVGLPDYENTPLDITADLLERDHIEFVLSSLLFEKLAKDLPSEELEKLENMLPFLLGDVFTTFDNAQKVLQNCQEISKDLYLDYIENSEINQKLVKEMEISNVFLEYYLPEIKTMLPNITDFTFIINQTAPFGVIYKKIINEYIDGREHDILNIKVGCNDLKDWGVSQTLNGRFIEQTHSYSYVTMKDYQLTRTKKEQ